MKDLVLALCGFCLVAGSRLAAQSPAPDVVSENLFPSDLVMQYHEAIGVTEAQKNWFREEMNTSRTRVDELQSKLGQAKGALAALLKKDRADEAAVMAQAEKALNLDRDIKREHFLLLVHIKNKLTPEQQAKLTDIKARGAILQEKLRKTQELAKQWQAEGKDLSQLEKLKDEFEPLVREGKVKEAEAVLDRALKILQAK